jgi:hypothetical protein
MVTRTNIEARVVLASVSPFASSPLKRMGVASESKVTREEAASSGLKSHITPTYQLQIERQFRFEE